MKLIPAIATFAFCVAGVLAPFPAAAADPVMIEISAGSFQMGSDNKELESAEEEGANRESIRDELPRHLVTVNKFWMSETEITRDQFAEFKRDRPGPMDGPCWVYDVYYSMYVNRDVNNWVKPFELHPVTGDETFKQPGDHPVVCVTWGDANAYAEWLSAKTGAKYRLPTEAEWEYAARAGSTRPRYWNDNSAACAHANVTDKTRAGKHKLHTGPANMFPCDDGNEYTTQVGKFNANAFGLKGMLGNVWEWTHDCYHASYYDRRYDGRPDPAPTNGKAWTTPDSTWPHNGGCEFRVVRGGGWNTYPALVRVADRSRDPATARYSFTGFRVVREE